MLWSLEEIDVCLLGTLESRFCKCTCIPTCIYIALAAWEIMTEGHYSQESGHNWIRISNLSSILTFSLIFISVKYSYFLPFCYVYVCMCVYIYVYVYICICSLSEIYKKSCKKKSRNTVWLTVISYFNEIFLWDQRFLSC